MTNFNKPKPINKIDAKKVNKREIINNYFSDIFMEFINIKKMKEFKYIF